MTDYTKWLLRWFNENAPHVELRPEDNYFDNGAIDSLGVIELIEAMEQTFSVSFTQDDFQDRRFQIISGLSSILSEKRGV